ncbi:hypothetical protein CSUI_009253, partial [Cystoisospora suis]
NGIAFAVDRLTFFVFHQCRKSYYCRCFHVCCREEVPCHNSQSESSTTSSRGTVR